MTIGDYTRQVARALATSTDVPLEDALRDVSVIMRHALGWDTAAWLTRQRETATESLSGAVDPLVRRRAQGEPVAYLIGQREFYGRLFHVGPDVLVPRPETEMLVERACALIHARTSSLDRVRLLDIGTGSGCIAISIACECPDAIVTATDVSAAALAVASTNAVRHSVASRIRFIHGSLTAGTNPVDLIVTNPPYIPDSDGPGLMRDVRDFEPHGALFSGTEGLDVIRALVPEAFGSLTAGGTILLEIGAGQAVRIAEWLGEAGFVEVTTHRDLSGRDRMIEAKRPTGFI